MSAFLSYQVCMNVLANLALGVVASGLILMFYGDYPTTVTPSQIACGLFVFALILAANRMVAAFILTHSGTWFIRRAKFAIKKMADLKSKEEEAEIMSHLVNARNLFITSWTASNSNVLTELITIIVLGVFSYKLLLIGAGLYLFGKVLTSLDDMYLVREQHKIFEITKQVSSNADSDIVEHSRFFHNHTSTPHVIVKLGHILFAYMSPVIFFYSAIQLASEGDLTLSTAMSGCVFFIIASNCAITEHGTTTRTIKRLFHTSKLLDFDKKHGGVFKIFVDSPNPDIPYSRHKVSTQFTYTHTEKAAFIFTLCSIVLIVLGTAVFVTSADVDFSCTPVEVACGHVPDSGSKVYIDVDASLSFRQGCTISKSVSEVVKLCSEAVLDMETVEEPESLTFNDADEEEFELELDAIQDLQTAADASSAEQLVGGNEQIVVISAEYSTWGGKASFQQAYTVVSSGSGGRRRLSDSDADYALEADGGPSVGGTPDVTSEAKHGFLINLSVSTKRHSDTKDAYSARIVYVDGNGASHMSEKFELAKKKELKGLGTKLQKSVGLSSPISGTITGLHLIAGGKDGLKFSSISIDGYEGEMKTFSKCRGSKKKGTWNCEMTVPLLPPADDGACVAECSASSQPSVPDLSVIAGAYTPGTNTKHLTYTFGSVWNDCDKKGPVRFTYGSKCDEGCLERAHSFSLSPISFFGTQSSSDACQQSSTAAYPTYCSDGTTPYSDSCSGTKVSHDRGHQVPANNFDNDAVAIEETNYMVNIMPQAAQMNRGAWLKTEMMVECWRNVDPISVVGGAVYIEDCTGDGCEVPEWVDSSGNKVDRVNWFMDSHRVKNPAYFWKMIIRAPEGKPEEHIAFWMPNHESAKASAIDDYVVSVNQLEANLAKWGAAETFTLQGDKGEKPSAVGVMWAEPAGCFRG
mmetsp:Transcript_16812/g.33548  ORF Transcript_16812/g.33548 Transcript_16812/m.33548 type:complete len:919 (+) Transcript_16812:167-2923(+)